MLRLPERLAVSSIVGPALLFSLLFVVPSPALVEGDFSIPLFANIVDVTRAPYFADSTGREDATEAINRAITAHRNQCWQIYLPAGTYLVSNTIGGSEHGGDNYRWITIRGQGPGKTVIKLKDGCPGFQDVSDQKAVVRLYHGFHSTHSNHILHLTINTGKNNPGANGLAFASHNGGGVENVHILTEDNQGIIGLDLGYTSPGPQLVNHVKVTGFHRGIHLAGGQYSATFDDIVLEGQRRYGIYNLAVPTQIRGLKSTNTCQAINTGGRLLVLVDAELRGGDPALDAVVSESMIYVRDLTVDGYRRSVYDYARQVSITDRHVAEYCSDTLFKLFPAEDRSLHLDVPETPDQPWGDPSSWARVTDADEVREAVERGETTIFFPGHTSYNLGTVRIHNKIRRIMGFSAHLGGTLIFDNPDPSAVVVVDQLNSFDLRTEAANRVVMKRCVHNNVETTPAAGDLFIEDFCCGRILVNHSRVFGVQINTEAHRETKIVNNGGLFWILGLKTEGESTVLHGKNGARSEILGGLIYPADPTIGPMYINENSDVSILQNHAQLPYKTFIREIRDGYATVDTFPEFGQMDAYVTNFDLEFNPIRHNIGKRKKSVERLELTRGDVVLKRIRSGPCVIRMYSPEGRLVNQWDGVPEVNTWRAEHGGCASRVFIIEITQDGETLPLKRIAF